MVNKKICMLGTFAVGKTAMVRRFVSSIFSDKYLSSVGVKISKKVVDYKGQEVNLMLWDLEGHDVFSNINQSYLRGAMGVLLVADGTRGDTLSVALSLRGMVNQVLGEKVPQILLINKEDIKPAWEITDKVVTALGNSGIKVMTTSAKTGLNVEEAFLSLTAAMMEGRSNE